MKTTPTKKSPEKENKLPEIPVDPQIRESYKAFLEHLQKNLNIHSKKGEKVTKLERRLDSLARLIEGNSKCTAVYYDNNKIYIASNKIHANSKKGNSSSNFAKHIMSVMDYFSDIANSKGHNLINKMLLIKECAFLVLKDKLRPNDEICGQLEEILETFLKNYLSQKLTIKKWRKALEDGELKIASLNNYNEKLIQESIKQISRTIRDFSKVENYINSNKDRNLTDIFKSKAYEILYISAEDIHAEIKILAHIIKTKSNQKIEDKLANLNLSEKYIGIAKLCCGHCALTLQAFSKEVKTRGTHGQLFKWKLSSIITNSEIFKNFIGEKAYEIFLKLNDAQKILALKYITFEQGVLTKGAINSLFDYYELPSRDEMYADESSSEEEKEPEYSSTVIREFNKIKYAHLTEARLKSLLLNYELDATGFDREHMLYLLNNTDVCDMIIYFDIHEAFKSTNMAIIQAIFDDHELNSLIDAGIIGFTKLTRLGLNFINNLKNTTYIELLTMKQITLEQIFEFYTKYKDLFEALDNQFIARIIIDYKIPLSIFVEMYNNNREKFNAFTESEVFELIEEEDFEEINKRCDSIQERRSRNGFRSSIELIDVLTKNLSGHKKHAWNYISDSEENSLSM